MPEEYKDFLMAPMEGVNEQQKHLNAKRKAIQKMERLKQAKQTKIKKWESFKTEMSKHLRTEQERYDKDMQDLEVAIAAAVKEAERIEQGLPEETQEELEEMLEDQGEQELQRLLQEAREESRRNQEQIRLLQAQVQTYMQQAATPQPPAPDVGLSIETQNVKTPVTAEDQAKAKAERRARMDRVERVERQLKEKERERSPRRDSQESLD